MDTYWQSMKATVGERGQVTIPKALRDRLGIRPGQMLEFEAEDGRLVARKASPSDPIDAVYGIFGTGRRVDTLIDKTRGPADAS
jgi:AbrB family looped-hinge helix DNA binding protein